MPPLFGPSSALAASKTMQDAQVPEVVADAAASLGTKATAALERPKGLLA